MVRLWQGGILCLAALVAGCFSDTFTRKKDSASGIWADVRLPPDTPPAPVETASRVDSLGRQILAANPTIAFRPVFIAVGSPRETVFHQGKEQLYISDGLVKRCRTEGELAAVLCLELGKMASEQEAQRAKDALVEDDRQPLGPPLNRDIAGSGGATPDQTEVAERAKLGAMRARRRPAAPPPPDPHNLARVYMEKAGFKPEDLTKVGSLLKAAELNPQIEQQIGNANSQGLSIPQGQPAGKPNANTWQTR